MLKFEIDDGAVVLPQAVKHRQSAIPVIPIKNFFITPPIDVFSLCKMANFILFFMFKFSSVGKDCLKGEFDGKRKKK